MNRGCHQGEPSNTQNMMTQRFKTSHMFSNPDNERAKELMDTAQNLDELKAIILEKNIGLQGSSQYFDAQMLIHCIDCYVQDGDTRNLTSVGNFRFKVICLKNG